MLCIVNQCASFRILKNISDFSGVKARIDWNHYETGCETTVNYLENRRAVCEAKRYTIAWLATERAKVSADRECARTELPVAPDHIAMNNRRAIWTLSRGFV